MAPEVDLSQNFELGPYLSAAFICETIIEDKQGVLSAIRLIDRYSRAAVVADPKAPMEAFEYGFWLVVGFKSGENPGVFKLTIQIIKPTNEVLPPMTTTIHLEDRPGGGANLCSRIQMTFDVPGEWKFDVLLNDKRVSRIPFNVIYLPQQQPQ